MLAVLAGPVWAADPPPQKRLKEVEAALEKSRAEHEEAKRRAEALAGELGELRGGMVAAARAVQEHEENLSGLEIQFRELKAMEAQTEAALERRREQMTGVLTALQRLAWRPTEALIAQPASPADTVRSAILLRSVLPRIEDSAKSLRDELTQLASLRDDIDVQRQRISGAANHLAEERRRIEGMVAKKARLQQQAEERSSDSEKRLARLADEAKDLRELMARLEQERRERELREAAARAAAEKAAREAAEEARRKQQVAAAAPPPPPQAPAGKSFSESQGGMPLPARGKIVARYGDHTDVGTAQKGITIETRPGARVVAPHEGLVAFAGRFRGYGLLLIIEHGEGYHTLLAGMSRIDGTVGQRLLAGEPVGVMEDSGASPTLYVELRHNGQPINPLPWLAARKDKVSG
ncbi:MAG: peptidoglycan DD-metalloendopeptidase family protein [Alphaproteobacteria bacterium]|nr:peptidoglycan DD-metalloendopeptidase family protein [Alphaproteobacteria bacterium]